MCTKCLFIFLERTDKIYTFHKIQIHNICVEELPMPIGLNILHLYYTSLSQLKTTKNCIYVKFVYETTKQTDFISNKYFHIYHTKFHFCLILCLFQLYNLNLPILTVNIIIIISLIHLIQNL